MQCKCGGTMDVTRVAEDEEGNYEYEAECQECGRLIN